MNEALRREAQSPETTEARFWELLGHPGGPPLAQKKLSVSLLSFEREKKIPAIKIVRIFLGLGLKESKELVESAPCVLESEIDIQRACQWKYALESVGATIKMDHPDWYFDPGLCLCIAQNPAASRAIVEHLSLSAHPETHRALAQNPATPIALLTALSYSYAEEILQNPLLPLLLLEDGLLGQLPARMILNMMRAKGALPMLLPAVLASHDCLYDLAHRPLPEMPHIIWEAISFMEDSYPKQQIAAQPEVPLDILLRLAEGNNWVLAGVASNPKTPVTMLERFLYSEFPFVRSKAAQNPNTPRWHLIPLQRAGANSDMWISSEQDLTMSPEELTKLAKKGPFAAQLVARHPNTSKKTLRALSYQNNEDLLICLLGNPKTPTAPHLLSSISIRVRALLASHRNSSPEMLSRLSKDEAEEVRIEVADNPNTSPALLTEMLSTATDKVRRALFFNDSLPQHLRGELEMED